MMRRARISRAEFTHPWDRRISGRLFTLVVGSQGGTSPRFACIVSLRVARRAVDRNRIKRRCREAARAALKMAPPRAYAFYARGGAAHASFADIEQDVREIVSRAILL